MVSIDLNDIKACIFDMDGTLVDSMWIWEKIDIDYLGQFGIELPKNLQASIEGMSFSETADYFVENLPVKHSKEEMMEQWNKMAMEKYTNEVYFKAGAEDFVKKCKEKGIKLGIATSNSRELFDCVRKHLKLDDYFDYMITGSEIISSKPKPDIYLKVAEELKVKPEECIVFEDIIPGIMAGVNAGMKTVCIDDIHSKSTKGNRMALADYFIKDYTEILF